MICWKCREPVNGPVCVGCGAIQPPRGGDYFAMLGIDRSWHLDPVGLEDAWRRVSRLVHPDRFSGQPAVERRMSLQWTVAINEARRVLRDPRARARYLATGRANPLEEGGAKPDPDFLEEVFDLQMEARTNPGAVRERARELQQGLESDLQHHFDRWEQQGVPLDPARIEDLLGRLKYLDNALALVAS